MRPEEQRKPEKSLTGEQREFDRRGEDAARRIEAGRDACAAEDRWIG